MVAGGALDGSQEEGGAAPNQPCGGAALVDLSVAAPTQYIAVARSGLARGGVGEEDLRRGGKVERRRRNHATTAWVGRERARVNVPVIRSSRARQLIPRTVADVSDLAYRIGQNDQRTKKFTAQIEFC
jgi:hypothetical protein